MKMKKQRLRNFKCESKDKWEQDKNRKYLWRNDTDDMQVMIFKNEDDSDIKCLWLKILVDKDYMSNYFIYSTETTNRHPLDYALDILENYRIEEEEKEEEKG
jgi:hypothetical protein